MACVMMTPALNNAGCQWFVMHKDTNVSKAKSADGSSGRHRMGPGKGKGFGIAFVRTQQTNRPLNKTGFRGFFQYVQYDLIQRCFFMKVYGMEQL